ncbi:MAG: glycoside hydrolase family 16 protein [Bacteroidales bacterium]|nr:glycoside hydrolase family 16 protein [Bacteroidales bacterium]MCB9028842.1 glycoside hydrolase family 16 protein [Bacteroidales bacterium]NLE34765.1 glycoside hydrolase family 16 protein [Bacteroidales bacterium]
MVLVWNDEFDYNGLPNPVKWSYDTEGNTTGWGNNELQYYTASRLKNAEVKDGYLHITAHLEEYEGFSYTSARLVTRQKGDWLYGRVEVKARIPDGRGLWPAIWMLPTDWSYGGWPSSGEIDIMENVGYDPYKIHGTVHTESYNHILGTHKGASVNVQTCYTDFHLYALEWDTKEIRIYVDDNHYFTFQNEGTDYKAWPFDRRFHLLLNVAVGGNWGGQQGVDDSVFPRTMVVDYIRVYQKK